MDVFQKLVESDPEKAQKLLEDKSIEFTHDKYQKAVDTCICEMDDEDDKDTFDLLDKLLRYPNCFQYLMTATHQEYDELGVYDSSSSFDYLLLKYQGLDEDDKYAKRRIKGMLNLIRANIRFLKLDKLTLLEYKDIR